MRKKDEDYQKPEFMDIEVKSASIIKDTAGKPDFTVYLIQVETSFPEYSSKIFEVKRRYNDFVWLRNYLTMRMEEKGKKLSIPELPGDTWSSWFGTGRFEKEFIEERRLGLDQFMKSIVNHPWARFEEGLHKFLEKQDFICQE